MKFLLNIKNNYLLWLAILVAIILRFAKLDFQSLWLDEIYTMNMADPKNSISDIYGLSQSTDPQSVLYFILLNITFKIVGFSSFVARFYSLSFGIFGVYAIYLLGKEIRNKNTGLIAAFLLSINYFHLFYSQEARVYTMLMASTCLSFLYMVKFLKAPTARTAVFYGLGSLLMILSHFFGLFTLISQLFVIGLAALYKAIDLKKVIRYGAVSATIVIIGFLPVVPILLVISKVNTSWIQPITNRAFSDLYSVFFGDSYLVIVFSIVLLLFYLFNVFKNEVDESASQADSKLIHTFSILLVWILVTFFIPYFRSFLEFPMFTSRYMITILPAILLMLAIGFDLIRKTKLKTAMVFLFLLISFLEIWVVKHYYKNQTKSDFRATTKYLVDNNVANSKIVTSLPYHFNYYLSAFESKAAVEGISLDEKLEQLQLNPTLNEPFWFIEAHGRTFSPTEKHLEFLKNNYDEVINFQSFDSWTKYFVPKYKVDSTQIALKLNSTNFYKEKPYTGDNNLYLNTNSAIISQEFFLEPGNYKLVLKARSTPAIPINGENAHLRVFANTSELAKFFLNKDSFLNGDTIHIKINEREPLKIKIEFDNDTSTKKQDRNVVIRELILLKN